MRATRIILNALVIVVGALIGVAGLQKSLDPSEAARFVQRLAGTGDWRFALRMTGIYEICLGVLLMTGPRSHLVLAMATVTLTLFSLILVGALQEGISLGCGCISAPKAWGAFFDRTDVGLARNVGFLVVLVGASWLSAPAKWSIEAKRRTTVTSTHFKTA